MAGKFKAARRFVGNGASKMRQWLGGLVGIALIALIISACVVAMQKQKRQETYREGFMDCGAGFCTPP
jgi:hypothetical protein